jgi:hypothetical protein
MLPSLLFDPELMARRGYSLSAKPALPIVFAGSPGENDGRMWWIVSPSFEHAHIVKH